MNVYALIATVTIFVCVFVKWGFTVHQCRLVRLLEKKHRAFREAKAELLKAIQERAGVQGSISQTKARIETTEKKIARLRARLAEIEGARQEEEEAMERGRELIESRRR